MSAMGAAHTIGSTLKVRLKSLLQEFLGLSRELLAAVASDAGEPAAARALNLGNKPRPVAEVMRAVLAKDTELSAGCEQLEVHLIFERKCSELRRQISREDKATAYLIGTLRQVEKQLTRAIDTAEPAAKAYRTSVENPVDVEDLLYVAKNVSYTVRSRPGFSPGMPMRGFLRPSPLPTEMCSGWLMHECMTAMVAPAAVAAATSAGAQQQAPQSSAAKALQGPLSPTTTPSASPGLASAGMVSSPGRKRMRTSSEDSAPVESQGSQQVDSLASGGEQPTVKRAKSDAEVAQATESSDEDDDGGEEFDEEAIDWE